VGYNLREDFAVPHVVLRAWTAHGSAAAPELGSGNDATRELVSALAGPHCAHHTADSIAADLFGETAAQLKSFALIPLRASATFGVLALASEDAERFYPEMGTVFLKRIGEMVSTAVLRYLPAA
jgi:uncharacterized protein YigA (DUF484 family)